jgi:hypothetical protein
MIRLFREVNRVLLPGADALLLAATATILSAAIPLRRPS